MRKNGLRFIALLCLFGFALWLGAAEKWSGTGMLLTEQGKVPVLFIARHSC